MRHVNRQALIITPKPHFFAMLTRISGEHFDAPDSDEKHENSNVYLIPGDFIYSHEALVWVQDHCRYFFELETEAWFTDESKWPKETSWLEFGMYFDYSIQSMVMDVSPDEEIYDEE